jgi:hypothetical protein
VSTLGVVSSIGQTNVANHVTAAVSAAAAGFLTQSIAVAWTVYSPTTGNNTPITSILVGNQCDTIRHRNRNHGELYTSFAAPATTVHVPADTDESILEGIRNTIGQWVSSITTPIGKIASSEFNVVKDVIADLVPGDEAGDDGQA